MKTKLCKQIMKGSLGKVLLLGNYPPPYGGVSIHVSQLAKLLSEKQGCTVRVLDVEVSRLQSSRTVCRVQSKYGFVWRLMIELLKCRVVHLHTNGHNQKSWFLIALTALAAKIFGVVSVLTIHSGNSAKYIADLDAKGRKMVTYTAHQFTHIVAVNEQILGELKKIGCSPEKISVIPAYMGLCGEPEEPEGSLKEFMDSYKVIFCTVASFQPEYGLPTILDFMHSWRMDHKDAGLVIVASGGDPAEIRDNIDEKGLEGCVRIVRDLSPTKTYGVLQNSTIFIRATHFDGDAISVREALSLNTPVVATATPFRPEGVVTFKIADSDDLQIKIQSVLAKGPHVQDRGFKELVSPYCYRLMDVYDALA